MKHFKRNIALFLIVCALLFFGYYRDFIFKNINALLQAWDYDMVYNMPSSLHFLEKFEDDGLTNIKWLLTLLFSIIYMVIAIITVQLLFKNKRYVYLTIVVYVGLIAISGLFIGTGFILKNTSETMYAFARYLMGMAQSPLVLMILVPAFKLTEKQENNY